MKALKSKIIKKDYNRTTFNSKPKITIQRLIDYFGLLIEIDRKAKIVRKNEK